jgi:hypothetical protein
MRRYEDLSQEASDVIDGMIGYCLNRSVAMGMDKGFKSDEGFDGEHKHDFRLELEQFIK